MKQHGVVARRQLIATGLSGTAIDKRVLSGRLQLLHRGVYSIGGTPLTARGYWMAAVLACGRGALLSHRSAAALWDLLPSAATRISVTGRGQSRRGIHLHRSRNLHPEDHATHDAIPVTSVARTIIDLAAVLSGDRLRRLIARADELRLFDLAALDRARDRIKGRQGLRALGHVLTNYREPPKTRSKPERKFVDLCRRACLPAPVMNAVVEDIEVDAFWPEHRLIVELDSYEFHSTRAALENDRARDARLQLAGYRVQRFMAVQLSRDPDGVAGVVKELLRFSRRRSAKPT